MLSFGEEKLFPYTHWDCVKGKPRTVDSGFVDYDNSVSGLASENIKDAIDELNAKHFDVTALESWTDLLHLVRSGRAKDFINIGDQFVSQKGDTELVWDVIGIDADVPSDEKNKHSITLQLRDCYNNMPFSVPEASYFSTIALKAGKYYIKMKNFVSQPKYYNFTLNETLPSGGLIRICENTVYLYQSRNTDYFSSFPVDVVSESEDDMSGTFLNQCNYHIHVEMGNTNYAKSDIREWLNSTEKIWWTHKNDFSLEPIEYSLVPGFCSDMDEDFLKAVNPVKKKTVIADGSVIETEDKFFLLSTEEVNTGSEGAYEYYIENATTGGSFLKDPVRVKLFESTSRHWWLRNSANGDGGLMRVLTDGAVGNVRVKKTLAYGIAPACCIC